MHIQNARAEPTAAASMSRRRAAIDASALACGFLVLYALTVFPSPPPVGDAADYTALLRDAILPPRMAGHVGYYLIMRPVMTVGTAIGLSATMTANVAASFAMAGAMAAAYLFLLNLSLRRSEAVIATLILGLSGLFWYNALFGEVNALCILLCFASAAFFVAGRPLVGGSVFGIALLVSQLAATWAPVFLLLAAWRKDWKRFALATACGALTFGLGILPVLGSYLHGPRGVFSMAHHTSTASLAKLGLFFPYRMVESFTLLLPAILVGIPAAWRRYPELLVLTVVLCISTAVLSIRASGVEYGVTWMPAMIGVAALGAIGLDELAAKFGSTRHRFAMRVGPVLLAGILSWVLFVSPKRLEAVRFAQDAAAAARVVGPGRVVAPEYEGMTFVFVTQPSTGDVWRSNWVQPPRDPHTWEAVLADPPVFALSVDPTPHLFRRWIFSNPIAARLLSEARRADFTSEQEGSLDESLAAGEDGIQVEPVFDTGYLRVWRLCALSRPNDCAP